MDYPEMRRKDRQLPYEEAYRIIENAEFGILSLSDQDHPYGVALSHVVCGNIIYFHSANQGFKVDLIQNNPKGYFLFIKSAETVREKGSVRYESCGAVGLLRRVDEPGEKRMALKLLADRHMGAEFAAQADNMIQKHGQITAVFAFDITAITGKHND